MQRISWCLTSALAALALSVSATALHAKVPVGNDPFIGSVARYEAAAARLADLAEPPMGEELARIASEAITAAYFAERFPETAELFAKYRGLQLDPVAQVTGLGATLQASADDAVKQEARSQLAQIGSQPANVAPLAPALSQAVLGADAMGHDDLPGAINFFSAGMELAQRDLAADDPAQVMFALQHARHLQFLDADAGRLAVDRSEKLALEILPEGHPHWISVWWNMVERTQLVGRFDEASALYARIADLAVREWGEDDPRMYVILQNRAIALSQLGQWQEAVELARAAIVLEGGRPGGDRAMHRAVIGGFLLGDGQIAEAADSYREGLALMEGIDPTDFRWGFIRARLARAASMLGEDAEALQMADLAAPIFVAKLPPIHPARMIGEAIIAKAQARSGAPERGFALLEANVAANEAKLLDTYARAQDVRTIAAVTTHYFMILPGWR